MENISPQSHMVGGSALYGAMVRLRRLQLANGRYFVAVLDDGPISGPVYPADRYRELGQIAASEGCSAVMAYPGFFRHWLPPTVDVGRIINTTISTVLGDIRQKVPVFGTDEALRCAADAIAIHASIGVPDEGPMLSALSSAIERAHLFGLVTLVALYARDEAGAPIADTGKQAHAARCAVELGADLIKVAWFSGIPGSRHIVEASSPVPVLIAGGPPGSDNETVRLVRDALSEGASGICLGRRLLDSSDPRTLIQQLTKVLVSR